MCFITKKKSKEVEAIPPKAEALGFPCLVSMNVRMSSGRQKTVDFVDANKLDALFDAHEDALGKTVGIEAAVAENSGLLEDIKLADEKCLALIASTKQALPAKHPRSRLLVMAATLAILAALVLVQAAGVRLFRQSAEWTTSVFTYVPGSGSKAETNPILLQELQNVNFASWYIPSPLPGGYEISCIESDRSELDVAVVVTLVNEEHDEVRIISIRSFDQDGLSNRLWEKTPADAYQYFYNGRTYYIFENLDGYAAVWGSGRVAQAITGAESVQQLKEIIQLLGG